MATKKFKPSVLTNSFVGSLSARDKIYEVRDVKLKGFLVRIYPSGNKTYRCEYKRGKHITLGRANVVEAAQARAHAETIIGDVARGGGKALEMLDAHRTDFLSVE